MKQNKELLTLVQTYKFSTFCQMCQTHTGGRVMKINEKDKCLNPDRIVKSKYIKYLIVKSKITKLAGKTEEKLMMILSAVTFSRCGNVQIGETNTN